MLDGTARVVRRLRERMKCERVDGPLHEITERAIHGLMLRDARQALELIADDRRLIVILGAREILELEHARVWKSGAQERLDVFWFDHAGECSRALAGIESAGSRVRLRMATFLSAISASYAGDPAETPNRAASLLAKRRLAATWRELLYQRLPSVR
jgi:hypothetical protein